MKYIVMVSLFALAACSDPSATPSNNAATPGDSLPDAPANAAVEMPPANTAEPAAGPTANGRTAADFAGRWKGVEGMYLVVSPAAGGVSLEMQWDLDNKGTFPGTITTEGIRFERGGATETLRPSDGDATGLKYLAGKKDCLTVKSGEGYCRD
jgi:hypothetical protein